MNSLQQQKKQIYQILGRLTKQTQAIGDIAWVWIQRLLNPAPMFFRFFFFFLFFTRLRRDRFYYSETIFTVHHCSSTVHTLKNIKNWSHGTIHTFKNYFATVFSVFSFSNNKFNPNRPCISELFKLELFSLGKK